MDHSSPVVPSLWPTYPVESCDVCGSDNKVYGRNNEYGGRTCHACMIFYRRWRREADKLKCEKRNDCEINVGNRVDCRRCRFEKYCKVMIKPDSIDIQQGSLVEEQSMMEFESLEVEMSSVDAGTSPLSYEGIRCPVCGDKPCARAYGGVVCNGCTKFFVRNAKQLSTLKCEKRGDCFINMMTRKRCQFCRLQKCLQAGMRPGNLGKYAKKQKSFASSSVELEFDDTLTKSDGCYFEPHENTETNSNSPISSTDLEWDSPSASEFVDSSPTSGSPDLKTTILEDIIRLHKESCAFTMDKVSEVLNGDLFPANIPSTNHYEAWHHFASLMDLEIRGIFGFLGNFDFLQNNHQQTVALLKNSAFKIYLLRVIRSLFPQGMVLRDGRVIDCPILSFIFGEQILMGMLNVSSSIRYANFTDDDIALLLVMVLLESNGKFIEEIQISLQSNQALMNLRPKLDVINQNFMNSVVPWLRTNHRAIQIPGAFSEVFGIPWTTAEVENAYPQVAEDYFKL